MRSPAALTLLRTKPWTYQTTYWDDGTARWDGTTGARVGAWQGAVYPEWFRRVAELAGSLQAARGGDDSDLTLIVESTNASKTFSTLEDHSPADLWRVALLLDGMTSRTGWVPLDTTGAADFSPWGRGVAVSIVQRGCEARALALQEGVLVLAGSHIATTTSATLEPNYTQKRAALQEDGSLTLETDRFRLNQHLLFDSPSAAASVVTGSNTNGRQAWRDPLGRPLSTLGLTE